MGQSPTAAPSSGCPCTVYPSGVPSLYHPGRVARRLEGVSLVSVQERFRQLVQSQTARSIAKCIALCAVGRVTSGRRSGKASEGKSCCG